MCARYSIDKNEWSEIAELPRKLSFLCLCGFDPDSIYSIGGE